MYLHKNLRCNYYRRTKGKEERDAGPCVEARSPVKKREVKTKPKDGASEQPRKEIAGRASRNNRNADRCSSSVRVGGRKEKDGQTETEEAERECRLREQSTADITRIQRRIAKTLGDRVPGGRTGMPPGLEGAGSREQ